MDELIFTLLSKNEPCVDDVMAVLRACVAAKGSAYCSVDDMKNEAENGKRIGFDTETAFRVQFHKSIHIKQHDNGLPIFMFDLFVSDDIVRTVNSPKCHVLLSSDLSKIARVNMFTSVATRDEYNERTLRK